MGIHELTAKIRSYKDYTAMISELEALKSSIADEIKALLTSTGRDTMTVGEYKVSYTDCFRRDVDKKALAVQYSDIYNELLRETTYKRFTVA